MLLIPLFACSDPGPPGAGQPVELSASALVFVDATLVPSGEQADVVVEGDRIIGLLEPGTEYLGEPTLVDASGLYLAPGLADLHVHIWSEGDLWLYLARGVTTIRNLAGAPQHLDWRGEVASGERAGPTLLTAGPIIDGPDAYWPGSAIAEDAEDAERIAQEQIGLGYDALKVYDDLSVESWEALITEASASGVPVVGHVPDELGYLGAAQGGQRTLEHLDDLLAEAVGHEAGLSFDAEAGQAALAELSDDKARDIALQAADTSLTHVPTLIVWKQLGQAEDWDFQDPRLAYLDPSVKQNWRTTKQWLSAEDQAWFRDYSAALCDFTDELDEAGASLALGTDVINPFVFPGWSAHEELALLSDCGLGAERALELATVEAAATLDQPGEFGVIEVGARADLVLVEGDPLQDLSLLEHPLGVMAAGTWYTAEELQAELDAVAGGYAR
jgi:uncharacterized protein YciI